VKFDGEASPKTGERPDVEVSSRQREESMASSSIILDSVRTRIVVDSSSNVPAALLAQYNMLEVPTLVNFGTESFRNNIDLTTEQFYVRFAQSPLLPTTSQPPPHFFTEAYQRAFAEGAEHILVVTVSAKFSGTFGSAQMAAQQLGIERFTLWDSDSASIGSGWQAIAAARLIAATIDLPTLLERLEKIRTNTIGYATLETLKYAALSGRVSNLQAGIGDLLQVKPVMELLYGKFTPVGRVRGRKRALREVVDRLYAKMDRHPLNVAVAHSNTADEALALAQDAGTLLNIQEMHIVDIGPVIATLTGPGTLALCGHPADLF
jgi:DegV family protein with EDD domain